jgi:hypothetical protein
MSEMKIQELFFFHSSGTAAKQSVMRNSKSEKDGFKWTDTLEASTAKVWT